MARKTDSPLETGCGCLLWIAIGVPIAISYGYGPILAIVAAIGTLAFILHFLTLSQWAAQRRFEKYFRSLQAIEITNGHDFEHFVACKLRENGMKANVTAMSGDQGVDIVARTRKGTRIAIQTKHYSKPVSGRAVQEVLAGMAIYGCTLAVVVTNHRYTRSAIDLANANGVKLIGFEQLQSLERGTHWIYRC